MTLKREGRTIYVPLADSQLRAMILPGSGIIGTVQDNGLVLIDFEGDKYGSSSFDTFEKRVLHAHDRHTWGYPTIARATVNLEELVEVGFVLVSDEAPSDMDVLYELEARYSRRLLLAEVRRAREFEIVRRQLARPRVKIDRQDIVDEWCGVRVAT